MLLKSTFVLSYPAAKSFRLSPGNPSPSKISKAVLAGVTVKAVLLTSSAVGCEAAEERIA